MKHKGRIDESIGDALESLDELIGQTRVAIDAANRKGDWPAVTGLVLAQQRNLKLLLHKLEIKHAVHCTPHADGGLL